ncbi:R8 protein [Emydomyces testavorans]|uniref:R8 protein n=1 Tax=Emydomyces testavorans TaxID=2070801 RepID=A0AAF0IPM8_9EURO|nr:R8 protein [Emydomyces testavorans]
MDAQAVRDRMMTMLKVVHGGGLDPDAGKARPDQLVLPEDPAFVPSLMLPGLNLNLSALDITAVLETPRKTSTLLSSYLHQSSGSSQVLDKGIQLNLSSSQMGHSALGGFSLPSEMSSAKKGPLVELPAYLGEEEGVLLQPDFEFDAEGNIIELPASRNVDHMVMNETAEPNYDLEMAGANHDGLGVIQNQFEDLPIYDEDVRELVDNDINLALDGSPSDRWRKRGSESLAINEMCSTQQGAQMPPKKRRLRNVEVDDHPELRNSDLAQWNSEYMKNMAIATKVKENSKLITVARKNAALYVLGVGIAAVGLGLGASQTPHPLNVFSGSQLLSALTGTKTEGSQRKRNRSVASDSDSEGFGRNVRQRNGDEVGRGAGINQQGVPPFDDIEIGRHGPPSLQDDVSSQMPWNITASVYGSQRGSSVVGGYSGLSGPNSAFRPGQDLLIPSGRRGRLTSASPLAGRGTMRNASQGPFLHDEDLDMHTIGGIDMQSSASEMFPGQKIGMSSPAAPRDKLAEPQWFLNNLDQQSVNFLEYVKIRIEETPAAPMNDQNRGEITFTSLLPPVSSSRVVATQGFLHVLTLATNGALRVRQGVDVDSAKGCDDAGEIFLSMAG